jgi:hypothetical protein
MRIRLGIKYPLSMFVKERPMLRRRIIIRDDDVLVVGGFEMDAAVLKAMLDINRRLLWTFVHSEDGESVQPIAISEERCIWLQDSDLERTELPCAV